MTLPERLIKLRKNAGLSQEEVAEKLEVTRQTVSKWETGQSSPDLDKVLPLCNLYGVTPDELLHDGGTERREKENNRHSFWRISLLRRDCVHYGFDPVRGRKPNCCGGNILIIAWSCDAHYYLLRNYVS